ncbi:hypothetical protein [Nocardia sp. NBC_01327]|nr:hypothetical protein OG326_30410 [Nocardia sp. NBC_01327]
MTTSSFPSGAESAPATPAPVTDAESATAAAHSHRPLLPNN